MRFEPPESILEALDRLTAAGHQAYLVGGCVRDDALGVRPHDYDIACSAEPEETKRVFSADRTIDTGLKHGTVTVLLAGEPIEITTFRRDGEYLDGRHPESVRFSRALSDDLSRRDFTINAMAYGKEGLIDPFGGMNDLNNKIIRCVGDPSRRFQEDALRILRALRFSSKLGFTIEKATREQMNALKGRMALVSRERVFAEMTGLIMGRDAARVMHKEKAILFAVLPMLDNEPWARALRMVQHAPPDETARWAALLSPYGRETAKSAARSLKMSNALTKSISSAAAWLDKPLSRDDIQYRLTLMSAAELFLLLDLRQADGGDANEIQSLRAESQRIIDEDECVSLSQLAVRGSHLIENGIAGAQIGHILRALLRDVALHRLPNERQALLDAARRMNEAQ